MQSSSDSASQETEQELIVLIEQETPQPDDVELMPQSHNIVCDEPGLQSVQTTICAKISLELVVALRALDRHLQDVLPPYMVPYTYVVIDKIASATEEIDHGVLNRTASKIPQDLLTSLRENLRDIWARTPVQKEITPTEAILQSSWARILKVDPETIDIGDNFFRLGGDSVLAMKLVSDLRLQGHLLTVADIFQHMRLRDAAKVLKVNQASKEIAQPYKPFSTLERSDVGSFLLKDVRPKLMDSLWSIQDVLPVTDSQALDIRATIQSPRTSVQYTMLYLDNNIDGERLLCACNELVKAHQILRTIFVEHDSTFFQVVVDDLHAPPALRYAEDLEALYMGVKVADFAPFSSYIARICNEQAQSKALSYWRGLLRGSSLSLLTETSIPPTDKAVFLTKSVDVSLRPSEITMASLLAAAWALVLARRLQTSDVTFGSVTSGRLIDLPNIENVMGPCYQFTPVRVPFKPDWTVMDLLRFVQGQMAQSAAHDFLGFQKISTQCTDWSSKAKFFDSIVHHQDHEYFDTMDFAGGTCRVDISNPHGDAVHPWKVVTLPRDGQTHVGIVGSEKNKKMVEALLDELAATTNELSAGQPGQVLLEI
ncbi:hypothetical protein DV737_g2891, partial [Chaetothyriales sp. CBS 132003]